MNPLPFVDSTAAGPALFCVLVLATFVTEDLTCFAAGLLVAAGQLRWFPAVAACFVGIALGDAGVWLLGRVAGRQAARRAWLRRRLSDRRLANWSNWLVRHGGKAAFASRLLPGTRVPLLLAAGVAGRGGARFLLCSVLAALAWAPVVVLSVARFGATVPGWVVLSGCVATLAALRLVPRLFTRVGRARLVAKVSRAWRWEFWPAWAFYLPLVPWFLWLAVRYRGFTVWTAANPGIPAGGVVGESKFDALSRLPEWSIIPTVLVPAGGRGERVRLVCDTMVSRGWHFPLVLKPDAGQRGAGVKKVHDTTGLERYLLANRGPVIAQPFHPGPFEAGIFYYRFPGDGRGRIFSITDKVFPVVVGDGRSTLEELIWSHPRFRMQAAVFLARHAAGIDRVLAEGERLPLATAGNHCQGTLFQDGSHWITPALEAAVDAVARHHDGFFIGRFDVRYADPEEFRAGRGFAVVELNGATSESTNLYDPSWPPWRAYRTLFRQWSLLFQIGHAARSTGRQPITLRGLASLLRQFYRDRTVTTLAD